MARGRTWTKAEDAAIRGAVRANRERGITADWPEWKIGQRHARRLAAVAERIGRTPAAVHKRAQRINAYSYIDHRRIRERRPLRRKGACSMGDEHEYDTKLHCRVPRALALRLRAAADAGDRSVSDLIRGVLEAHLRNVDAIDALAAGAGEGKGTGMMRMSLTIDRHAVERMRRIARARRISVAGVIRIAVADWLRERFR